ncbi:MAG: hypothetical protein D6713_08010, partial [Deltaproteobacteria bacterium]
GGILYILLNAGGGRKESPAPVPLEEAPLTSATRTPAPSLPPEVKGVSVTVPPGAWRRNPFLPYYRPDVPAAGEGGESGKASLSLKLEGIIGSGESAVALINGTRVRKGDKLLGWRVDSIGRGTVALSRGGVKKTLTLVTLKGKVKAR